MAAESNDPLEVAAVSMGDFIASVGRATAEAQQALDMQAIESFRTLYGGAEPALAILREINYQPNWYHIPEVTAEMSVVVSIGSRSESSGVGTLTPTGGATSLLNKTLYVMPVNATYTSRYDYNITSASQIKFKVVPIPAPPQASALRVVPVLKGRTISEARRILSLLELDGIWQAPATPDDSTIISSQEPGSGTFVQVGSSIKIS